MCEVQFGDEDVAQGTTRDDMVYRSLGGIREELR